MSNTLTAVLVASLQLTHLATESLGRISGRTSRTPRPQTTGLQDASGCPWRRPSSAWSWPWTARVQPGADPQPGGELAGARAAAL